MVRFYNPLLRHGEIFFSISCEKLIQFLEVKLTKVWKVWARTHTHTHGVLALRFVHTEPLVIQQLVWVLLFQLWFLLLSLCSCKSKLLVFVCLSDLEGSLYALFFPSLMDLRKIVDFSVHLIFYLLWGWVATSKLLTWEPETRPSCSFTVLVAVAYPCALDPAYLHTWQFW